MVTMVKGKRTSLNLGGIPPKVRDSDNLRIVASADQLSSEIEANSDRKVERHNYTQTISIASGTPTLTGYGTTWRGATPLYVDDLLLMPDGEYYKIKSVDTDEQLTFYGNYNGLTISAPGTPTNLISYYLDWITFFLMPGYYILDGVAVYPGQAFTSIDPFGTVVQEYQAAPGQPITNWSENRMFNIGMRPAIDTLFPLQASLDGILNGSSTGWAGMVSILQNCNFDVLTLAPGGHGGGAVWLPCIAEGRSVIKDTIIQCTENGQFAQCYQDGTFDSDTTFVDMENVKLIARTDAKPGGADPSGYGGLILNKAATYNLNHCVIRTEYDNAVDSNAFEVAGISTGFFGNSVLNLSNSEIRLNNTSAAGDSTYGLHANAASVEFNVTNCNIQVDGTTPKATHTGNASSTINVRTSRLAGLNTGHCINAAAGTINYDNCTLVGTNNGGTAAAT